MPWTASGKWSPNKHQAPHPLKQVSPGQQEGHSRTGRGRQWPHFPPSETVSPACLSRPGAHRSVGPCPGAWLLWPSPLWLLVHLGWWSIGLGSLWPTLLTFLPNKCLMVWGLGSLGAQRKGRAALGKSLARGEDAGQRADSKASDGPLALLGLCPNQPHGAGLMHPVGVKVAHIESSHVPPPTLPEPSDRDLRWAHLGQRTGSPASMFWVFVNREPGSRLWGKRSPRPTEPSSVSPLPDSCPAKHQRTELGLCLSWDTWLVQCFRPHCAPQGAAQPLNTSEARNRNQVQTCQSPGK